MGIKFFGQFLVEKQIITREALQKAVALQRKTNLLFGETARAKGLITDADIERVQAAQRKQDLDFGSMCVDLGILTPDQAKLAAEQQKMDRLHLGDALVRTGAIQSDALPKLLEEYDADEALYYSKKEPLPAPIPHEDLWQLYADRTYKMFIRVVNLTFKPDQHSLVDGIDPNDMVVAMRMTGDVPCAYVLSVSGNLRDMIARAMLRQDDISSEPKEVLVDAVKEFVNIICGTIASKLLQMGKHINFGIAEVLEVAARYSPAPCRQGLLYPLHVDEGRAEVAIFWE